MGCVSTKDAKKHGLTVLEKKDREKPLARQKKQEGSEPTAEGGDEKDSEQNKGNPPSPVDNDKEL